MVCGILMVFFSITAQQLFQMVSTDFNACILAFQQVPVQILVKKRRFRPHIPCLKLFKPPNLPSTIEFRAKYSVTSCLTVLKMSDLYTVFVF